MVILLLQHPQSPLDWRITSIIQDIIDSLLVSISWTARKVNRSANFCAHSVAHWAATRSFAGRIPIASPNFELRTFGSDTMLNNNLCQKLKGPEFEI